MVSGITQGRTAGNSIESASSFSFFIEPEKVIEALNFSSIFLILIIELLGSGGIHWHI